MTEEIWKPVVGYEGKYAVSNLGRVRSLDRVLADGRRWRGRVLSPNVLRTGHMTVQLSDGTTKRMLVHRLVLMSFVGPCPPGMEGCHFPDRNPRNCRLDNLRWDTPRANQADRLHHGTYQYGEKNASAKLTKADVLTILGLSQENDKKQIGQRFGISPATVGDIWAGRTWRHLPRNPAAIGSGNVLQ